jgi:hypothetical protein
LQRELHALKQPGAATNLPRDPMLHSQPALRAPSGDNVVPLPRSAALPSNATQSDAPPETPAETDAQRIARLRWDAGDRPQALRAPFDNGYGRDFGLSGGATRFDNKVPLP